MRVIAPGDKRRQVASRVGVYEERRGYKRRGYKRRGYKEEKRRDNANDCT